MPAAANRMIRVVLDDEAVEQLVDGKAIELPVRGTDVPVRVEYVDDLEAELDGQGKSDETAGSAFQ